MNGKYLVTVALMINFLLCVLVKSGRCDPASALAIPLTGNESPKQIASLIVSHQYDAPALFRITANAISMHQITAAYNTLDKLSIQNPSNPLVLEAFCLVWNAAGGNFAPVLTTDGDVEQVGSDDIYYKRLKLAYKEDPKPWIGLITNGFRQMHREGHPERAVIIMRLAVKDAPDIAYTHYSLASALCYPNKQFTSYTEARSEAELAYRLNPRFWSDAMLLFDINNFFLPNHAEALHWKKVVLALTPDVSKLDNNERRVLNSCQ